MLSERVRSWGWWPVVPLVLLVAVALFAPILPQGAPQPAGARSAPNQTAHHPSKVIDSKSPDERLADYTRALAWFTGALAIVGGAGIVLSAVQVRYLVKADRRAAEAADGTRQQMLLTAKQADILERQQGLANEEFFAVHRPRLVLKDVFFSSPDSLGEVTFEVSNIGDSIALVSRGFVTAEFVTDPRVFKDWQRGERELLLRSGVKAGQLRPFAIRLDDATQKSLDWQRMGREEPTKLKAEIRYRSAKWPKGEFYFFGAVEYIDGRGEERGTKHLTIFRRMWNPVTKSFDRTGNPDHEYAD